MSFASSRSTPPEKAVMQAPLALYTILQDEKRQEGPGCSFGLEGLDVLLGERGFSGAGVLELCGPSGAGKTWICHKAMATVLDGGTSGSVLYVDTGGSFSPSILMELCTHSPDPHKVWIEPCEDIWRLLELLWDIHAQKIKGKDMD
ncbi:MAG: hypothetical protein DHS80DRAFT_32702 [Piptocephalis tieghemiana]|nr:MAG: hypothetical protein DHS80DRAFT_32702 [Piptocephalis tieghemiana]